MRNGQKMVKLHIRLFFNDLAVERRRMNSTVWQ